MLSFWNPPNADLMRSCVLNRDPEVLAPVSEHAS